MTLLAYYLAVVATICTKTCHAVSGINCEGSGFCPLATFVHGSSNEGTDVLQGLRDALYASNVPGSTSYGNGDHIVCVTNTIPISIPIGIEFISVTIGGGIPAGGICAFPQQLPSGTVITLAQVRSLVDYLVQHGCHTCGSVPITYPGDNKVANGELTFNFVSNPACTGSCIENGAVNVNAQNSQSASPVTVTVTPTTAASAATILSTSASSMSKNVVTIVTTPTSTVRPSTVTSIASAVTITETSASISRAQISASSSVSPPVTVTVTGSKGVKRSSHDSSYVRMASMLIVLGCIMSMM